MRSLFMWTTKTDQTARSAGRFESSLGAHARRHVFHVAVSPLLGFVLSMMWSTKTYFMLHVCLFVCVEALRPSQVNGAMSSAASLLSHTFTVQALSSKRLSRIMHSLSPETDNCPS